MKDVSAEWAQRFAASPAVQLYEDVMVPRLFEPWAHVLLDAVGLRAGDAVLDVATGPGTVARVAAERGASVTACDFSPAMLDMARSKSPGSITYVESPAAPLAVDDDSFDVAVCQHGMQFFPDRPAALAEMRRALRHGGRLGIAVWGPIEECPVFAALGDALGDVLGDDARVAYARGPWSLGDADAMAALVGEAGFGDVKVELVRRPVTFEGGAAQLLSTAAVTALAERVAAVGPDAMLAAVTHRLAPFTDDAGAVSGPLAALITTAVR